MWIGPFSQSRLITIAFPQVGQLPRHDLCRAYCMLASSGAGADTNLLRALRRALRQRLNLLKPPQLVAALSGLAGLQHRDALLMDELARCAVVVPHGRRSDVGERCRHALDGVYM